jgi:hypothetical protein
MHDVNMYHAVVFARLGLPELACQSVQVSVLRDGFSDTVLRSQEVIYFFVQKSNDNFLRFSKVNTVLSFFESTFFLCIPKYKKCPNQLSKAVYVRIAAALFASKN